MSKLKTAVELAKLKGPAIARYIKMLKARIKKLTEQKTTPARKKTLEEFEKALNAVEKRKTPTPTKTKSKLTDAEAKRIKELNKKFDESAGRPTTATQRARINARKQRLQERLAGKGRSGTTTTLRLTEEGEKLLDKADDASLRELERRFKKYTYETVSGKPVGKTAARGEKEPIPELRSERIEERLRQRAPSLTRDQAADAIGISGRGTAPSEAELIGKGGFEVFKKGGLKKFQSRVKYGGKEYSYAGGGKVEDIPHFKLKKKPRKK